MRAKRRDKDTRLKTQAQTAKSQKRTKLSSHIVTDTNSLNDDIESQAPAHKKISTLSNKAGLPAFLPDELLAAEPIIQQPQLLLPINTHVKSKKTKLSEKREKGPKDVRRGNTIIRVFQAQESMLPPKSSSTSKSVREEWLLGRRVPRRKTTGSFIRK